MCNITCANCAEYILFCFGASIFVCRRKGLAHLRLRGGITIQAGKEIHCPGNLNNFISFSSPVSAFKRF